MYKDTFESDTSVVNLVNQMSFTWSACTDDQNSPNSQGGKRTKMSHHTPVTATTISSWDIDGGLAADFDGSLSGLGAELGSETYNMSEALLALPVFKQENLDNGFQYILGAATSPAVKVNEETLTYLNQGQSYEIKLKKLGDLTDLQGTYLRSTVKVCFHERRLQYMEKEQLDTWKQNRQGERILDIDVPLSYGLSEYSVDSSRVNAIDYVWEPTKETGIYVRVNCISTEFTAKKHGGEKGVPFRLQVETKEYDKENAKLLHCASCQIKVFKPKGADRKHKTDREKMVKRTGSEKEKYQPSYECTVLTEIPLEQVSGGAPAGGNLETMGSFGSLAQAYKDQTPPTTIHSRTDQWNWQQSPGSVSPTQPPVFSTEQSPSHTPNKKINTTITTALASTRLSSPTSPPSQADVQIASPITVPKSLSVDAGAKEVMLWLQYNRFSHYCRVFQNFSGADLMRLTRDDLIQICGLADGIRLNNALHSRTVRPRLTIYICQEASTVYRALYLEALTVRELTAKISELFSIAETDILESYIQGPSSIQILVTDEVVQNFQEQTRFWLEAMEDKNHPECFNLLLKAIE